MNTDVLVVEDDIANQQVAVLLLKKFGYKVKLAIDGEIAVELAMEQKYSLILMDCQMPRMDGYDASIAIRKNPGPNQTTPIIALTANLMEGIDSECLAAGMDDVLNKPVLADNLKIMVEKWRGKLSQYHLNNARDW